jgi:hypothetical protein
MQKLTKSLAAGLAILALSSPAFSLSDPSSTRRAPEIEVALAGSALALVVGGALVLTAKRRKKASKQ